EAELDHWASRAEGVSRLPVDHPGAENTTGTAAGVGVRLGRDETRALLHEAPGFYGTQINDVLLTALAETCRAWTGQRRLLVHLEGHGREELFEGVDLTRTVGWFTSLYPVRLDSAADADLRGRLRSVREQLARVPGNGIGYGLLRHLGRGEVR